MARGLPKLRREVRAEGSCAHSASPSSRSYSSLSASSSSCLKTLSPSDKPAHLSSSPVVGITSKRPSQRRHNPSSSSSSSLVSVSYSPRRNEKLSSSPGAQRRDGWSLRTATTASSVNSTRGLCQRKQGRRADGSRLNVVSSSSLSPSSSPALRVCMETTKNRGRRKKASSLGNSGLEERKKKQDFDSFCATVASGLEGKSKHLQRLPSASSLADTSRPYRGAPSEASTTSAPGRRTKGHKEETTRSKKSSRSSASPSVDSRGERPRRKQKREGEKKERQHNKKKTQRSAPAKQVSEALQRGERGRDRTCRKRPKTAVVTSPRAALLRRFLPQKEGRGRRQGMDPSASRTKKNSTIGSMGDKCSSPRLKAHNREGVPGQQEASAPDCDTAQVPQTRRDLRQPSVAASSSSPSSLGGGNTPRKRQKKDEGEMGETGGSSTGCERSARESTGGTVQGKKEAGKNSALYGAEDEEHLEHIDVDRAVRDGETLSEGKGMSISNKGRKRSGVRTDSSQDRPSLKKGHVPKLASTSEGEREELPRNSECAAEAQHDDRAACARQSTYRGRCFSQAWVNTSSSEPSTHGEDTPPPSSPLFSPSSSTSKKRAPRLCLSSSSSLSSACRRALGADSGPSKAEQPSPSSSFSSALVRRDSTDSSSGGISSRSSGVTNNNVAVGSPSCSPVSSPVSSSSSVPPPPPPLLPVLSSRDVARGSSKGGGGGGTRGKVVKAGTVGGKRSERGGRRGSPRLEDPAVLSSPGDPLGISSSGGKGGGGEGSSSAPGFSPSSASPSFSCSPTATTTTTTLQGLHRTNHRHWQNNCLLLYEHVMAHTLEWPSLTAQWMNSYDL